jgi:hypothetical protein
MIDTKTNWTSEDYYNFEDLNKVESNTQLVAEYIRSLQYDIPELITRTDRNMTSIDFKSSIERVQENIEKIRMNFLTPLNYQGTRENISKGFSYIDANRLEDNIQKLYELALIVKDNLIYCGTFNCGSEWEGGLF